MVDDDVCDDTHTHINKQILYSMNHTHLQRPPQLHIVRKLLYHIQTRLDLPPVDQGLPQPAGEEAGAHLGLAAVCVCVWGGWMWFGVVGGGLFCFGQGEG